MGEWVAPLPRPSPDWPRRKAHTLGSTLLGTCAGALSWFLLPRVFQEAGLGGSWQFPEPWGRVARRSSFLEFGGAPPSGGAHGVGTVESSRSGRLWQAPWLPHQPTTALCRVSIRKLRGHGGGVAACPWTPRASCQGQPRPGQLWPVWGVAWPTHGPWPPPRLVEEPQWSPA